MHPRAKNTVKMHHNCFICDAATKFSNKNIFTLFTKHSQTPIYKYLEKFLNINIYSSISEESYVCEECLIKLDDYDLASQTTIAYEKEFTRLLGRTHSNVLQDTTSLRVKEEQDEMDISQSRISPGIEEEQEIQQIDEDEDDEVEEEENSVIVEISLPSDEYQCQREDLISLDDGVLKCDICQQTFDR